MFRQSTGKEKKKKKNNHKKTSMKLCKTTVTTHSPFLLSHNVLPCILKTGFSKGHGFLDSLMEKHPFFHVKYII